MGRLCHRRSGPPAHALVHTFAPWRADTLALTTRYPIMEHYYGTQGSDTEPQSPYSCPPSAPATPRRDAGPHASERFPLPDLVLHRIASLLPANEAACNLRLASRSFAVVLCGPQHTIVRMSQPVPEHAIQARWGHPDATRSLTLRQRQGLLCRVAVAGVVGNLRALEGCVGSALTAAVLAAAAGGGQLDMCKCRCYGKGEIVYW